MSNVQFEQGLSVENDVSKYFINHVHATIEQDMREHWDIRGTLYSNNKIYFNKKFDVKSIKRINRYDPTYNENFHWVEIASVYDEKDDIKNQKNGWLYGEADYIIFEVLDYYIIVDRQRLMEFIEKKSISDEVKSVKDLYVKYQRKGRKDIVVLVKTIDLMIILDDFIKK